MSLGLRFGMCAKGMIAARAFRCGDPGSIERMIRWLLASWAVSAAALAIAGWILSGVSFHGSDWTLLWAALVFGILNSVLKPVLKLLTFPLAVLTLGIAWLFVSMLMLWLTAAIVNGFDIDGFWS